MGGSVFVCPDRRIVDEIGGRKCVGVEGYSG